MNTFVACAKCCAKTILCAFIAFKAFAVAWTVALAMGWSNIAVHGLQNLDLGTTIFVGLAAGFFARHDERAHSYIVAAIAAALVETLHASIGGGLIASAQDSLTRIAVAVAAALACAGVATRMRPAPSNITATASQTDSAGTLP